MKKVINYKVQKEEWLKAQEEAFKKLNAKATIDGFRKGKATRSIFERNFPGKIVMEAADKLVDKEYKRIIMESQILPILEPKVDIVKVSDEEFEANFTFITEPEVKLGEYKNLKVKKASVKVTKEEVQEKIDGILRNYAELIVKEDGATQNGDVAVIDFEGFKDGVAFDGGKGDNYSLEIGSNSFIPGFEEGVIGMKKGETKDLNLTFPEEYHAEDLGMEDVNTKEELESKMKDEIKADKEQKAEHEYIDALLEKAVSNMIIELDEEIVDAEAESMYNDFMHHMSHQGITEEIYLQYAGTTKEDIISRMKEEAEKRLKNSYLLNAIIKEEKIEVAKEEALEEIKEIAIKHNMTEEDVTNSLGGIEAMIYDLKVRKAVDLMKDETK